MNKLFCCKELGRFLLVAAMIFTGSFLAKSATFTVTRTDDRNEICNSGVDCSLREAVAAARTTPNAGVNIVNFSPGLSLITLTNEIEIVAPVSPVEIRGPGANLLTIDGGAGTNRIFSTLSNNFGSFTISGLTLTGGNGVGNNRSGFGGAIHIDGGTMLLDGVNITGNSTSSAGGGVLIGNGTLRIINSTISANTAFNCGGASGSGSQMTIVNSTISGNTASQLGGGICASSNTALRNVTITNNTGSSAGGILKATTGTLEFGNTIVAGNSDAEIRFNQPGIINSLGNNLVGDAPGDAANTGNLPITYQPTDILDTPPQLAALSSNGGAMPTHAPAIGSPAVDHGSNSLAVDPATNAALTNDQRGFERFRDGDANTSALVDIGAFELRASFVSNTADSGTGSLRQTIAETGQNGDAIGFTGNLFETPQTILLTSGELLIQGSASFAIYGTGADRLTISGNHQSRVLNINTGAKLTVKGVTLADGNGVGTSLSGSGGGIFVALNGVLTLNDSVVKNNQATLTDVAGLNAPALVADKDSVSLGVTSGGGGGIYNAGSLVLNRTTIAGNKITVTGVGANGDGGGIYNLGTVELNSSSLEFNSTESVNTAFGVGAGGLYNGFQSIATFNNSTVSNNTGRGNGGGINNNSLSTLNLNNSTISNNSALGDTGFGGGIINFATVNAVNSTIAANFGESGFGGVLSTLPKAVFNSKSSIYSDNTAAANPPTDFRGTLTSGGYNLIANANFTIITGIATGNIIGQNAQLLPLGNFGGPTKTHALRPTSPAIDKGSNNFVTGTDQRGRSRPFDNSQIPNAFDGSDIGAFERQRSDPPLNMLFDFDGDSKTDISIYRPAVGEWWIRRSFSGQTVAAGFGVAGDKPVPADFTGDGKTDIAFWRPASGEWFILRSEDGSFFSIPFGAAGDVPLPSDFDADGRADAVVFRPSTNEWFILKSSGGTIITTFGQAGDVPVVADYDGDGKADIAIFRPADGSWWYIRSSDNQFRVFSFGNSTDKPVPGDYTGDGKTDIAVFRPSTGEWFIQRSEDNSYFSIPFGTNGDLPVAGDYDGDGKFDAAVFRPSSSTWFINRTTAGILITNFGITGDQPLPNVFVP